MAWFQGDLPLGMNRYVFGAETEFYVENGINPIGEVMVGRFSYLCSPSVLIAFSPISIGSFCSVAANFHCVTHEQHPTHLATTFPLSDILGVPTSHGGVIGLNGQKEVTEPRPITIGNDVWIGDSVTVFGGVTIPDGCVIGAKSLVTKDCVPYGIYVGTPAKLVRLRFPEKVIEQLLELKWWDWSVDKIRANLAFFETDLTSFDGQLNDLVRNPELAQSA